MHKYIVIILILSFLTSCNKNNQSDITLDYKPMQPNINTAIIDLDLDINVIKESNVLGYKSILYKIDSEGDIYGGVYLNDKVLSIGPVSMNSTPDDLLVISESNVFGKNLIKFSGIPGANYAKSVYLEVEDELVTPLFEVDGNIIEIDLDQDGIKEMITTIGTIADTNIYKYLNNQIYISNLNRSINAQSVIFNMENHGFEAYFENNKSNLYYYKDGKLELHRK